MAYLFIRTSANLVFLAPERFRMPGTVYLNMRAYFKDQAPGQIVASNEEYAAYGVYPVHFLPPPDYNPYRQWLKEEFHFNPGEARIDRVLVVRTLSQQDAEALHGDWFLPQHWIQWLIHRNNWDKWLEVLLENLQVQHATWSGDPARTEDDLAVYPDFVKFLHKDEVSLAEMIDWTTKGLGYARDLGVDHVFGAQMTPSVAEIESAWDQAYQKQQEEMNG